MLQCQMNNDRIIIKYLISLHIHDTLDTDGTVCPKEDPILVLANLLEVEPACNAPHRLVPTVCSAYPNSPVRERERV